MDRRLGTVSHNRASPRENSEVVALYKGIYPDRNVAHFYEAYVERHGGRCCYNRVKNCLCSAGVARRPRGVPAVIFTDPEIAWCGITESEAGDAGVEIEVSKFPWAASGRALTLNRTDGLTKIIAHKGTGRLVGVGIVGPQAGELISESVLAIEMGATAEDMAFTIHPLTRP